MDHKQRLKQNIDQVLASEADNRLIHLALCALADFELDDVFLLPFIREIASVYLNYDEIMVRKQASLTCSKLLSRLLLSSVKKNDKIDSNNNNKPNKPTIHIEWEYRMKSMVIICSNH